MKDKATLLLVEDELALAGLLADNLNHLGFEVVHANDGDEALQRFFQVQPDLVLLDVMLPKVNGFEVAKTIRNTDRRTPILFLTAKQQGKDVVKAFQAGGNDYVRKPFSMDELEIRIRALLHEDRLVQSKHETKRHTFRLGNLMLDSRKMTLSNLSTQHSQRLTAREAELLALFCEHANHVLSKDSLLLSVWGDNSFFNSRSLDVFVSRLRKYLKEDPRIELVNIRGVGYKLLID